MVQDLHWEDSWAILLVIPVPVNYAIRSSGPVTALTACRVRYGVGPDLICQSGPSPGIKTHSSNTSLTSFCSLPPLSHLPAPPPRASGRARAPPTPLTAPLSPNRTD